LEYGGELFGYTSPPYFTVDPVTAIVFVRRVSIKL
jgi:hypothetical protein